MKKEKGEKDEKMMQGNISFYLVVRTLKYIMVSSMGQHAVTRGMRTGR